MSFNALPRTLFLITAHGRKSFDFGIKLLAVPDSTSQKFILLGQIARIPAVRRLRSLNVSREPGADCYVGHKFEEDPAEHDEPCMDSDYELVRVTSGLIVAGFFDF